MDKKVDKKVRWLRIAYWTAAVADFLVAILVLIPARMGVTHYVYPMGLMSAVAFSWGVLLIFADKQPLERRWILIPTILVVALLGIVAVHAGLTGLISSARVIPTVIITIIVLSILVYSNINARDYS
jgi:hypothetical protein